MSFVFGWIDGFIPKKDRSIVNGVMICFDNLTVAVIILYVLYVNRKIQALLYTLVTVGVLANVLTIWLLPESPKWLDQHGEKDKSDQVYNQIARFNGQNFRANDFYISDDQGF